MATVFSIILDRLILASDTIDYALILTQENFSISLSIGGSTLSGTEHAQLLKDMYIQLGDVCKNNNDIGYLRVRLSDEIISLEKLFKDKVYA